MTKKVFGYGVRAGYIRREGVCWGEGGIWGLEGMLEVGRLGERRMVSVERRRDRGEGESGVVLKLSRSPERMHGRPSVAGRMRPLTHTRTHTHIHTSPQHELS